MTELKGVIYNFSNLKPCTMTVMVFYDADQINLPAVFSLLPVTKSVLEKGRRFARKQGKIVLPPELNVPGEIISMRYNGQVRGIVRSEKTPSFSHSIITDIGTSEKIISMKIARGTFELTGATSYEMALEASATVLSYIKTCQDNILFMRQNLEVVDQINSYISKYNSLPEPESDAEEIIVAFYQSKMEHNSFDIIPFLTAMAERDNVNLYNGSLRILGYEGEMANILFSLGYPIIQTELAGVMNSQPFICKFNNANNASKVVIHYYYRKKDRNTGKMKIAAHTIRVNQSGHVTYSGPDLRSMEPVYYAFIKKVIENQDTIKATEMKKQIIRVIKKSRAISIREWKDLILSQMSLQKDILDEKMPMIKHNELAEEIMANPRVLGLTTKQFMALHPAEIDETYEEEKEKEDVITAESSPLTVPLSDSQLEIWKTQTIYRESNSLSSSLTNSAPNSIWASAEISRTSSTNDITALECSAGQLPTINLKLLEEIN